MDQLSDAELMRIAMGSQQTDVISAQPPNFAANVVTGVSDSEVVANRASPVFRPRMKLALHFELIANFDDQRRFIAYATILQLVLRNAQQALDSGGVRDEKEDSDERTRGSGAYREIAENRLQHATAAA